jgi:hypothetical protein
MTRTPSLDEIESALADFEVVKRNTTGSDWALSGPAVTIPLDPENNGYATVDIVDRPWPDHMGDPKTEPMLIGAWSMGHFGPFAYPGGLARAAQQSWTWPEGAEESVRHTAFIRIRTSYAFGAAGDDPVMPAEYEPVPELEFVTKVAMALLEMQGAICYFNPNGEMLCDQATLIETLESSADNEIPPLNIWSNVRLFDAGGGKSLMDTVGNSQLDVPDCEAIFHTDAYEPAEVDDFFRNATLYLLTNGDVIEDGDTMDGPGEVMWQAHDIEEGVSDPPRRVLRWLPMDDRPLSDE